MKLFNEDGYYIPFFESNKQGFVYRDFIKWTKTAQKLKSNLTVWLESIYHKKIETVVDYIGDNKLESLYKLWYLPFTKYSKISPITYRDFVSELSKIVYYDKGFSNSDNDPGIEPSYKGSTKSDSQLMQWYKEFNKKYFERKLPIIPVEYAMLKGVGGKAEATKQGNTIIPKRIILSTFFVETEDSKKSILLHEMIHIEMYTKGIIEKNGGHGPVFKSRLYELNQQVEKDIGVKIPISEEANYLSVSKDIKGKPVLVAVNFTKEGKKGIITFNPNSQTKIINQLRNYPEEWWRVTGSVYKFYISDNNQLAKFPMKRDFKKPIYYPTTEDLVQDIEQNGKYVGEISYKDFV